MMAVRRDYTKTLVSLVQNITFTSRAPNQPGNCPEFVLWGAICRAGGSYRSLCLSVQKEQAYKYCGHCEFLAKAAEDGKSIRIQDWYDKSSLITGKQISDQSYIGYKLKEIRTITEEERDGSY